MKASIIIPTCNRADFLADCLSALAQQTLSKDLFEVLVVDNASCDHTASIVDRYARTLQLRSFRVTEPGLHVCRHIGMQQARTDLLIYADDDTVARPTWIEATVEAFYEPAVVMVGGNNYPLFEAHPPGWLQRWWERPVYKGRALPYLSILDFGEGRHPIDPAYVWGCNFSIRRDVLLAAGGFHPDALPRTHLRYRGDGETHVSEFVRRTHGDALFDSRASVEHRVTKARMSCEYMVQRAYAQGISDSYTAIRRSKGSRPWIQRLGVACKQQVRRVFHRMASVLAWTDDSRRDLESILAHTAIAYLRGYTFHGAQVRKDPELLAWVLKPDYLA